MSSLISHSFIQRVLLGTTLVLAFLSPTQAWAEQKIGAIVIQGNKKIEKDAILEKIQSKVGSPYNKELVREDIRSIFSLNYFETIEVSEDGGPGGLTLTYHVSEKPIITKIVYDGLDAIDSDEAKETVTVKEFEVLDLTKVNQSIEKLLAKYEEKGYYLADIRYEVQMDEKRNEATLTFIVEENDKVQVSTINIIGNKVMSTDDLKKIMATKEGGIFSFVTGSGSYREALFERDLAALQFYYGTMGYVRARFGKPEVSVSPDKKSIHISFFVDEGQQYNVGNVDFSGELLFTRPELMEDLELIQGETFNTETLRRETLRYTDKYSDLGYAFANVIPQPIVHDDTRTVDIVFEIDRGERVYIGKVTVTSNTRTKDKVIRRELTFSEGDLFSGTRKRESRENVLRLGFFDSVEFNQTSSPDAPNVVDIEVKVKERSTGQLVIGAGYASGNIGFTAQAQLSQNNFLGNGQVASLSAQVLTGRKFYEFNLGFQDPYVGSSNWSLGGALYQLKRNVFALPEVNTFEETKTGFDVKLGHPVWEYTNLYLTYKLENSYVAESSIIDRTLIAKETVNGITSSVSANMVFDKRDDRFDPREGWFWSATGEYAGLGGARKYFKTSGNLKYFHPIVWDFIFRFNLQGANITQVGDQRVPINELFIQGGLFSLRGYDYLAIGPRRTISTNPANLSEQARTHNVGGREIVIGGHSQVLANAEIEFPILKEARIRGVLFFDAGNAFDGFFANTSPAILTNVGYGFRWFTPIGPLRFEFGYPIVGGGSPKFYFTIGPPF